MVTLKTALPLAVLMILQCALLACLAQVTSDLRGCEAVVMVLCEGLALSPFYSACEATLMQRTEPSWLISCFVVVVRNLPPTTTTCFLGSVNRWWDFSQFWEIQLVCWDKI